MAERFVAVRLFVGVRGGGGFSMKGNSSIGFDSSGDTVVGSSVCLFFFLVFYEIGGINL